MTLPPLDDPAYEKLYNVLGATKANEVYESVLKELGKQHLKTPEDRLAFGQILVSRGGVLEAIGRAIRVQAFLLGASEA
jgi:hypothetical protein